MSRGKCLFAVGRLASPVVEATPWVPDAAIGGEGGSLALDRRLFG